MVVSGPARATFVVHVVILQRQPDIAHSVADVILTEGGFDRYSGESTLTHGDRCQVFFTPEQPKNGRITLRSPSGPVLEARFDFNLKGPTYTQVLFELPSFGFVTQKRTFMVRITTEQRPTIN